MRGSLILFALLNLLFLVGCGEGNTESGGKTSSPTKNPRAAEEKAVPATSNKKLMLKLTRCLEEENAALPRRQPDARAREKLQAALEGPCKEIQTEVQSQAQKNYPPPSEAEQAKQRRQAGLYFACLRKRGFDLEKSIKEGEPLDTSGPRIRKITLACQKEQQGAPGVK